VTRRSTPHEPLMTRTFSDLTKGRTSIANRKLVNPERPICHPRYSAARRGGLDYSHSRVVILDEHRLSLSRVNDCNVIGVHSGGRVNHPK
jgi:hypothetical protein